MKLLSCLLFLTLNTTNAQSQTSTLQFPFEIKFSPTDKRLKELKIKEIKQTTIYTDSLNDDTLNSYIDFLLTYDSISNLASLRWDFRQEYFSLHPRRAIGGPIPTRTESTFTFSFGNTNLYFNPDDSVYYNFVEERYYWENNRIQKTEIFYPKTETDVDIPSAYHPEMQMNGFLPFITLEQSELLLKVTFNTSEKKQFYDDGRLIKEELIIDGKFIGSTTYDYTYFHLDGQEHPFVSKITTNRQHYTTVSTIEYTFYE
ncbi:MAG: hypothetical protein HWE22_17490 [Flavobacteriales bacterium]|nr:hypothetical protein [Flavobacteriales bacterium]